MNYLCTPLKNLFPPEMFTMEIMVALGWILMGELFMATGLDCISRMKFVRHRRVFDVAIPAGQFKRDVTHSWHVFLDAIVLYLFVRLGLLRPAAFSWTDTAITAVIFAVWVEIYFYCVHRAMHSFKALRPIHHAHHLSVVNTTYSGFASSLPEKLVLLSFAAFFMALLSWFMNITLSGIAVFYAYYYLIVTGGHCNTEFPVISRTMHRFGLATPTVHALHHARFSVNYGFAFLFFDRLFGTYSRETDELRWRALAGNGNRTLKRPAHD